ncbi:hypothetical protein QNH14_04550 [Apirhabdus apintestini]|nr:hypothetical protein QNH14_04550 [Enterobacteriaceae bacterium CA-0114]
MTIGEIPLTADNQRFSIQLGGQQLSFTLQWRDEAGWLADIRDENDMPLLSGLPLVTGGDLLAPYRHLGLRGELHVIADDPGQQAPGKTSLGARHHLWYISA